MQGLTSEGLLILHSTVIGAILVVFWRLLARRELFRWTTAGFWAWVAFGLYFVLNPLSTVWRGNLLVYEIRLQISGGTPRGLWILSVNAIAILVFFIAYLRHHARSPTWHLRQDQEITRPMGMVMIGFIAVAGYFLLIYRTGLLSAGSERIIEDGRFVGETTGYENSAYIFLFVPTVLLLLSRSPWQRLLGWLMGFADIILSLPHAWSRYATVSMLLAMSLADSAREDRARPRIILVAAALLLAATLQARGHTAWTLTSSGQAFLETASEAVADVGRVVGSSDAAMLATWYLESYVEDRVTGYDYGVPLVNYLLTGWIPYRVLPEKYFLVDWLRLSQPTVYSPTIQSLLYGAKSSLIGSFYAHGSVVAVILLMWLAGVLSRKLDGMLAEDSPLLIKAIGISWMSVLWMVWGSADYWGIMVLGALFIPGLAVWLFSPKERLQNQVGQPHGSLVEGNKDVGV